MISSKNAESLKRNVLVIYPFSQTYLPEFEAFNMFDDFVAFNLTDSLDIVGKLKEDHFKIRPNKITLPLGDFLSYKFGVLNGLHSLIEQFNPVAVITFELYSTLSYQVTKLNKKSDFKHVVVCYDTIPKGEALWGAFPPTIYFSREVIENSYCIVALSKRIREALISSGVREGKVRMNYPGVHSFAIRVNPPEKKDGDSLNLLYLGRLRENKGIRTLISAFKRIRSEGCENISLTIAGDGPMMEFVQKSSNEIAGINYVGNVIGERKWKLFSESDVFIYPSEDQYSILGRKRWEEQTAAAVREAMASGLPVIVSDSGSLSELVGRKEQVISQGDVPGLHDKILQYHNSSSLREELAKYNLKRSIELFDMKSFSRFIESAIKGE